MMSSLRQIQANRLNARLSTGPVTDEGKRKSRQNAVRHGLTAETVIDALEDAEDYNAFQLSVTSEYDAQSAIERELVLRLASLLWRLRRATAIETGLFKMQALHLLQFRQRRQTGRDEDQTTDIGPGFIAEPTARIERPPGLLRANESDKLTTSFLRLTNLPSAPLDRLSRYEATLWRQACQTLFTLQTLIRRRPWERVGLR